MKRESAPKAAVPAATSIEDMERSLAVSSAKTRFVAETINMGWKMAIMVIVPVFIGVKLDDRFHTEPSYTIASLFIAIAGASWVVAKTLKGLSKEQAAQAKRAAKSNKKRGETSV